METKLYIRDGKRFKYVPNMLGAYWNGTILTKERMQDSIAVVIEQHYDHVVMAFLKMSKPMWWYEAEVWCRDYFCNGRLPSNTELINLKKYITTDTINYIWGEKYDVDYAWVFRWNYGGLYIFNKCDCRRVKSIAVTDVPILNLI